MLGQTFKPNTDDMRDAPSIAIVYSLEEAGISVRAYDPEGEQQARPSMPRVMFCGGPYEAAEGADAVVLVTDWDSLRALDLGRLAETMAGRTFIDLRNAYPRASIEAAGLESFGIGRPVAGH